jgi:competence protein ComEC
MGTIYGDRRFRKNPSPANTPDGQTKIDDIPEIPDRKRSVNDKDEKIRQMISTSRPGDLNIVCLDAGQGDATIVRLPNGKIMVVDCNVENAPENIVKILKDAGIEKIDYLVITHPHQDHMSGAKDIADNFEVGEVWTTDYKRKRSEETPESYAAYQAYVKTLNKLEKKGATIRTPTASNDPIVKEGNLEIRAFGPSASVQGNNEDIHEESLVIHIKSDKTTALFPGDTTNHQLDRISKYYPINNITFLHAAHHGSKEGANEDVMRQISPEYTVISVGKGNPHGLPHSDAMKVYRQTTNGKKVYRTDKGTIGIRFNSDGMSTDVQE